MLTVVIALLAAAAMLDADESSSLSADQIVREVIRAEDSQRLRLGAYTVIRRYTVRNRRLKQDAVLQVLWSYQPGRGKNFKVLSSQGASGLTRSSLMKVLETEAKNSRASNDPARISPDHYHFSFDAHRSDDYTIRLNPRKKSKFLLQGFAVIVRQDPAIVRVEGRTSKRLSFWVSEADVIQEFTNHRGFWLPSRTHSVAHIRFVGRTELTIESEEYRFAETS